MANSLSLAEASVIIIVTGTEYFLLVPISTIMYNHILSQRKVLVCDGEPSGNNETNDVAQTSKKFRNLLFITHFYVDEKKRFPLGFFTGDIIFVTFLVVVLVDKYLDFLSIELELWMDLLMESARFWRIVSVNLK